MGGEYEGQTKVRWNLVGTELQLEIPKLRKRQAKLKSKVPSMFRECSLNVPIEGDVYKQEEYIAPSPSDSLPPLLVFPVTGLSKAWAFTQQNLDSLKDAFPSLDVMAEVKKAKAWAESNPSKRKTHNGMGRFLFAWVSRAQNSGVTGRRSDPIAQRQETTAEEIARRLDETKRRVDKIYADS